MDAYADDVELVAHGERWAYAYTVRDGRITRVEIWSGQDARALALKALE
jgi:hypothetical protein